MDGSEDSSMDGGIPEALNPTKKYDIVKDNLELYRFEWDFSTSREMTTS